jgi:hypothetical protein
VKRGGNSHWSAAAGELARSGAVEEKARGRCAGFFEAEAVAVMSSLLDHAEGGAGEELVEDSGGEVVAEHAGFDPSWQHG